MIGEKDEIAIFHTAFIGDIVLLGLLVEALYQNNILPILITNHSGALIYKHDHRIKKIVVISKEKGFKKVIVFFKNVFLIRKLRLSKLLMAHKSVNSLLLSGLSGAKIKIGFEGSTQFLRKHIYTFCVAYETRLHERLRLLKLIEPLISQQDYKSWILYQGPTLIAPKQVIEFPFEHMKSKKFIVVSPGSVWPTKVFPPLKMAEAISNFLKQCPDIFVLISGAPSDKEYIKEFLFHRKLADFSERIVDGSELLTLTGLLYLAPYAVAFLCNDSAPMHIASAFLRPVIAVFGPTPTDTGYSPTSPNSTVIDYKMCFGARLSCQPCSPHGGLKCPLEHHKCMNAIPADLVTHYLLKIL